MNKICESSECTACRACLNSCSVGAISMKEDSLEREIAVIDSKKCIDCKACVKICPNNKKLTFHAPLKCFAMRTKNEKVKKICSSGGIASTLGLYVTDNQGIYFGAKGFPVSIESCSNSLDVLECGGSKYTESLTNVSYKDTKKYLKEGKKVIYVGTPCQCAGLLTFLGKEYNNLLLIDLICHGVPPQKYLKEYLKKIGKKHKITAVSFRELEKFELKAKYNKEVLWYSDSYIDPYYNLFFKGTIFRENCYSCKYAREERVTDYTIGDFWGIEKNTLKNRFDGNISLCLINTKKGLQFFDEIKDLFIYEEREVKEAINGNEQLQHPFMKEKESRSKFERMCKKRGSRFAIKCSEFGKREKKIKIREIAKKVLNYRR